MHASFRIASLAAATSLALVALPASAASDMFLKIDGVEGESTAKGHEKEIEISSYSWGISQTTTGNGGRAVGKSCPSDLNFTKSVDKATPPLIAGAASGSVFANARLTLRKAGERPLEYLKIDLKGILIGMYQTGGAQGSDPQDAFSLRFTSMTVSYYPQGPDGTLGSPIVTNIVGC